MIEERFVDKPDSDESAFEFVMEHVFVLCKHETMVCWNSITCDVNISITTSLGTAKK